MEFTKNIIVNNAGGSLMFEYSPSVKFKIHNNILVSNTADVNGIASIGSPSTSNHLFNNNTIISKGKNVYFGGSSSYHANNITFTNNLFSNASNNEIIDIKYGSGHVFNNNNLINPSSTGYFLKNQTANSIDAENNYWGTTTESEIQAAIYDYSDDFELGAVDYTPFSTAMNTTAPISPPSNVTKSVSGSDVVLNWSANGESDIAGYKLYYGTPTGYTYTTTVDLGNVTTYTVTGGDIATEYAITAYDSSLDGTDDQVDGNESWFSVSNEVKVTLSTSATTIAEPSGSATITATLNNTSSADVTVNLSYSGTATNGSDFSGATSITVSAGSTTGTITLSVTDDSNVEITETIIVDVGDVSGASESGTQQVTINLTDNDLPSVSSIIVDKTSIDENEGVAVITATISDVQSKDVTIPLTLTGTSTEDLDYSTTFTSKGSVSTAAGDGSNGSSLSKLHNPKDVFVDSSGNIFIAEDSNNRVTKWEPDASSGSVVAGGNGYGDGLNQLKDPYSIVVDGSGNIFVSDRENHRVMKWEPSAVSGTVVAGGNGSGSNLNQLSSPAEITIDSNGNLYIADLGNDRVVKWEPDAITGSIVAGGNSEGSNSNQTGAPYGLYLSNDLLYISEISSHRISKWTLGNSVGTVVAGGNGAGSNLNQLSSPYGIHVDSDENLFVADFNNYRILKFVPNSTNGIVVAGGNGQGSANNQFYYPYSVY